MTDVHLTPRQQQLLELMCAGVSQENMAAQLGLTRETIRDSLGRVYAELRVHRRDDAIAKAVALGLVPPPVAKPPYTRIPKLRIVKEKPMFGGKTFDPARDADRLNRLLDAVYRLMADGQWRTLQQIALRVGGPEPSVSARLRDLRKERFGGHDVQRRHIGEGLWEYRLIVRRSAEAA